MAESTKNYTQRLTTSYAGGFITTADKIAVLSEIIGAGTDLEYVKMTKSLALAIQDLNNAIQNPVDLSDIQSLINAINITLGNLNLSADKISYSYIENGDTITSTVKTKLDSILNTLSIVNNLDEKVLSVTNSANSANLAATTLLNAVSDIATIKLLATELSTNFDSDGTMIICPESEYDSLLTPNNNTLYFCY